MLPLTLQAARKLSDLLLNNNALQQQVNELSSACNANVPAIAAAQVVLNSANADTADMDLQLTYPRICLYSSGLKNTQAEKFRSFSGTVAVTAEIWASGNLIGDIDFWIHFYVEGVTKILEANIGDWGDGLFFPGSYDVQLHAPKAGGFGYVQSAKVTCTLNVSRN